MLWWCMSFTNCKGLKQDEIMGMHDHKHKFKKVSTSDLLLNLIYYELSRHQPGISTKTIISRNRDFVIRNPRHRCHLWLKEKPTAIIDSRRWESASFLSLAFLSAEERLQRRASSCCRSSQSTILGLSAPLISCASKMVHSDDSGRGEGSGALIRSDSIEVGVLHLLRAVLIGE